MNLWKSKTLHLVRLFEYTSVRYNRSLVRGAFSNIKQYTRRLLHRNFAADLLRMGHLFKLFFRIWKFNLISKNISSSINKRRRLQSTFFQWHNLRKRAEKWDNQIRHFCLRRSAIIINTVFKIWFAYYEKNFSLRNKERLFKFSYQKKYFKHFKNRYEKEIEHRLKAKLYTLKSCVKTWRIRDLNMYFKRKRTCKHRLAVFKQKA